MTLYEILDAFKLKTLKDHATYSYYLIESNQKLGVEELALQIALQSLAIDEEINKINKENYKLTAEESSFQSFILDTLKNNLTETGELTPAAFFHLIDRLEPLTWRQKDKGRANYNSFEKRINELILLVGFDVLLVAHHLKAKGEFTPSNFTKGVNQVELVRAVYQTTAEVYVETIRAISENINAILNTITAQHNEATSKLSKHNNLPFFKDSIDSPEFIEKTMEHRKIINAEINQIKELIAQLNEISEKLKFYQKRIRAIKITSTAYKYFTCKKHYLEINTFCNEILREPKLIGKYAEIISTASSKFIETFSSIFELIENPVNDEFEPEKVNTVSESESKSTPVLIPANTISVVVPSVSFFELHNDNVEDKLPLHGNFKEIELNLMGASLNPN